MEYLSNGCVVLIVITDDSNDYKFGIRSTVIATSGRIYKPRIYSTFNTVLERYSSKTTLENTFVEIKPSS